MRKDEKVFVMGEEVGEYQGAYKITRGLLQEFGPDRVYDTPITELSHCLSWTQRCGGRSGGPALSVLCLLVQRLPRPEGSCALRLGRRQGLIK